MNLLINTFELVNPIPLIPKSISMSKQKLQNENEIEQFINDPEVLAKLSTLQLQGEELKGSNEETVEKFIDDSFLLHDDEIDDVVLDSQTDDETDLVSFMHENKLSPLSAVTVEALWGRRIIKKRKAKRKLRKIVCDVVSKSGDLDIKSILEKVLVAAIPIFASGVPAALLPFILAIIVGLLALGKKWLCK